MNQSQSKQERVTRHMLLHTHAGTQLVLACMRLGVWLLEHDSMSQGLWRQGHRHRTVACANIKEENRAFIAEQAEERVDSVQFSLCALPSLCARSLMSTLELCCTLKRPGPDQRILHRPALTC